jgi:hypothetical protein
MTRVMSVRRPSLWQKESASAFLPTVALFCLRDDESYYIKFAIFYDFIMPKEAN